MIQSMGNTHPYQNPKQIKETLNPKTQITKILLSSSQNEKEKKNPTFSLHFLTLEEPNFLSPNFQPWAT